MADTKSDQLVEYNDKKLRFLFKFCRFYFQFYGFLVKFPRYTRDYYLRNIASLPGEDNQLVELEKQIWLKLTPFNKLANMSFCLAACYLFVCLKYSFYMYYTVTQLDFKRPQSNLVKVVGKNDEHQFVCMTTNCSSFTKDTNELAQQLVLLPVFPICQPSIGWSYSPYIGLHQIGLIFVGLYTYYIFVTVIFLPSIALASCLTLRVAAFMVCPNIVQRLEIERTRSLCCKFSKSFDNFQWTVRSVLPLRLATRRDPKVVAIDHHDCLPINSSKWWHQQLISLFPFISASLFLSCSVMVMLFAVWANLLLSKSEKNNHRNLFNTTCSIWLNSAHGQPKRLTLDDIILKYNEYTIMEFGVSLVVISIMLSGGLNCILQGFRDILVSIRELKFQLELATRLAELRLTPKRICEPSKRRDTSMFSVIRQRFMSSTTNKQASSATKTKLDRILASQQVALELLGYFGCSGEVYADLLEKIHITYWNFTHLIGEYHRPFSALIFICYLINFGLSFISVYLSRHYHGHETISLLVIMIAVFCLDILIASASVVHTQAKRIEFKLWSLIAINSSDANMRVRHSNHLASKQLRLIDDQGGLALKAFGYNITYVNIIQVTLWTTSIILLTYTRR